MPEDTIPTGTEATAEAGSTDLVVTVGEGDNAKSLDLSKPEEFQKAKAMIERGYDSDGLAIKLGETRKEVDQYKGQVDQYKGTVEKWNTLISQANDGNPQAVAELKSFLASNAGIKFYESPLDTDPAMQKIAELESKLNEFKGRTEQESLKARGELLIKKLDAMEGSESYPHFNREDVLKKATEHNTEDFDFVYKALYADKIQADAVNKAVEDAKKEQKRLGFLHTETEHFNPVPPANERIKKIGGQEGVKETLRYAQEHGLHLMK